MDTTASRKISLIMEKNQNLIYTWLSLPEHFDSIKDFPSNPNFKSDPNFTIDGDYSSKWAEPDVIYEALTNRNLPGHKLFPRREAEAREVLIESEKRLLVFAETHIGKFNRYQWALPESRCRVAKPAKSAQSTKTTQRTKSTKPTKSTPPTRSTRTAMNSKLLVKIKLPAKSTRPTTSAQSTKTKLVLKTTRPTNSTQAIQAAQNLQKKPLEETSQTTINAMSPNSNDNRKSADSPSWAKEYEPGHLIDLGLVVGKFGSLSADPGNGEASSKQTSATNPTRKAAKVPSIKLFCEAVLKVVPGGRMTANVLFETIKEWTEAGHRRPFSIKETMSHNKNVFYCEPKERGSRQDRLWRLVDAN